MTPPPLNDPRTTHASISAVSLVGEIGTKAQSDAAQDSKHHVFRMMERGTRRRLIGLVLVLATAMLLVAVTGLLFLYNAALPQERARLAELARSQALFIQSVAEFDRIESQDVPGGPFQATLNQIQQAFGHLRESQQAAELTLGRRQGEDFQFLLRSQSEDRDSPDPIPFGAPLAEPMQRALSGQAGTIIGRDYAGVTVLAAYQPIPAMDAGLVAKIAIADVRRPYVRAACTTALCTALLVLGLIIVLYRLELPLIRDVERSHRDLAIFNQALSESERRHAILLSNLPGMVYRCRNDRQWTTLYVSDGAESLTGYPAAALRKNNEFSYKNIMHPDDRERIWNAVQCAVDQRRSFEFTYRIITADGIEKQVWERGRALANPENDEIILEGFITDITERENALRNSRDSEARFRALAELSPVGIFLADAKGHNLYVNPVICRFTGLTAQAHRGKGWTEAIHHDDRDAVLENWNKAINGHTGYESSFRMVARDGRQTWVLSCGTPLRNDAGKVTGFVGTVTDVSQQKKIESTLRRSEQFIHSTLNALSSHIAIVDQDGIILAVNDAWRNFAILNAADCTGLVEGANYLEACNRACGPDSENARAVAEGIRDVMAARRDSFSLEYPCHAPDRKRWFMLKITRFAVDGEVRVVIAHENITERKRAEIGLTEQKQLLENVMASIPHKVFWKDRNSVYLGCNDQFAAVVGLADTNEVVGKTDYDLLWSKEEANRYRDCDQEVMNSGESLIDIEELHQCNDGFVATLLTSKVPLRTGDGSVTGILGIFTDITERKNAELQLRLQSSALEAAANGIVITDAEGSIVWVNRAFSELTGYAVDEVQGANPAILKSGKHPPAFYKTLWNTIRAGRVWRGEIINRRKNGTFYTEEMTITPLKDESGSITHYIAVKSDVTERKNIENALADARGNLERRVEERTAEIVEMNRLLVAVAEISRTLLSCDSPEQVGEVVTNELVQQFGAYFARLWLVRQGDTCRSCPMASHCPTEVPCLHLIASAGHYTHTDGPHGRVPLGAFKIGKIAAECQRTITNDVTMDARIHDREWAREHQLVSFAGVPLEYNGRVLAVLAIFSRAALSKQSIDALELIGHSVSAVLVNVEHRDKLAKASAAKSDFLANMSHELRTPLNGVVTLNELLLKSELNPKQRRYAELARTSADALLALINDILDLSKIEAGELSLEESDFDLYGIIDEVAVTMAPLADRKGLELVTSAHPSVPRYVRGDATRLRQVLTNLINNAVKFTERGEVVVRITTEADLPARVQLRFTVTDTGIGIPEDRQQHIFEQFTQADSSTTRKYGGTGLGLAICRRIVERMGGQIHLHSVEGVGSTFWFIIEFPRCADHRARNQSAPSDIRQLRFLVVDDNETNREAIKEQLDALGLSCDVADNGESSLTTMRRAAQSGQPFHFAILDLQMPGMDGIQLASAIRNDPLIHDTVLMLLSSSDRSDPSRFREAGFSGWALKPLRMNELLDSIVETHTCASVHQCVEQIEAVPSVALERHAETDTGERPRILLVEDNEIGREAGAELVRQTGCQCDTAQDGIQAVEAVLREPYDLVLMDCHMPEMDGFQATREIRKHEQDNRLSKGEGRRLPIIALTADALSGTREKCLEAGMDDYLTKPLDPKRLNQAIQEHLANTHRAKQENSVTDANQNHEPIDVASLMERWGGSPEFIQKLLEKFRTQSTELLNSLTVALANRDFETATRHAHSLKGAAGYVAASNVQPRAAELEQACRDRAGDAAVELLKHLDDELKLCVRAIEDGLSQDVGQVDSPSG